MRKAPVNAVTKRPRPSTKRSQQPRAVIARKPNRKLPPIPMYTDEKIAEFLLNNSVNAEDYARAVAVVRELGLDPANIRHTKPIGVR